MVKGVKTYYISLDGIEMMEELHKATRLSYSAIIENMIKATWENLVKEKVAREAQQHGN